MFTGAMDSLVNSEKKKELSSSLHLRSVIYLLDALATLDALMAMKACLNNNFAYYRRCVCIPVRFQTYCFGLLCAQSLPSCAVECGRQRSRDHR